MHAYPYSYPHRYRKDSNDTIPVLCLCQEDSVCGCDENNSTDFTEALYQNATGEGDDKYRIAKITDVNGTRTLVVNGTLADGTTAPGGTDSMGGWSRTSVGNKWVGWWPMVVLVVVIACS